MNIKKHIFLFASSVAYVLSCLGILYALNNGGIRALFVTVILINGFFTLFLINQLKSRDNLTLMNTIYVWVMTNSICILWGVLYLAATGAEDIAETLGRYIVTEILGSTLVYGLKSSYENGKKIANTISEAKRDL
jgi:hypothetical protein